MLKLLIADDEQIIVDGIKDSIDWSAYSIEVVGTAMDGNEALEKAKDLLPDIVITDIRMPGMDGLELVEQIKGILKGSRVILISAFEQFEYAKTAITLGVQSYLTKPLKKQNLIEEVCKAGREIVEERSEKASKERLEQIYRSNLPILKEHYLNNLISRCSGIQDNFRSQFELYNINLSESNVCVFVCKKDSSDYTDDNFFEKNVQLDHLKIIETIREAFLNKYFIEVFQSHNREVVAILNLSASESTLSQEVIRLLEKLKNDVFDQLGISISIGIGWTYPSMNDTHKSYKEAVNALNYRLVLGNNAVIFIGDVEIKEVQRSYVFSDLNEILIEIQDAISDGDSERVFAEVEKITERLKKHRKVPYYYMQQIYCQLLSMLLKTIFEMGIEPGQISGETSDLYGELLKKQTFEDIDRWFCEIVTGTCAIIHQNKSSKVNSVVLKAVDFIKKHCYENITLLDVAEHVELNYQYLSRLFKEETGVQFIEYLKNQKIERAKDLLRNSNKKVYEICEELGYQSVQYFSTLFKNVVGMTPIEYKMQKQ